MPLLFYAINAEIITYVSVISNIYCKQNDHNHRIKNLWIRKFFDEYQSIDPQDV